MIYRAQKNSPIKIATLAAVIALHIATVNYLIHAQQRRSLQQVATSIKARIVEDVKTDSEKPLPLPLTLVAPALNIASPDISIAVEQPSVNSPPAMQLATSMAQTITAPIIATTGPRPDPNMENTFPIEAYPLTAKRAHQEGTVTLSLQILEDGSVNDAQIEKSSGFASLDNAAARYAQLHWRFIPGTRNGEAVIDWREVRVVFTTQQTSVRY